MTLALYRKYRPQTFKEVKGQDQVVNVLTGALKQGNISHAYLFTGSRGTGKTSVARILARELEVSDNDLYELDAASNRGIDDVRALREAVNTLPFSSKYKVYIIDEVHMLTKEAFNALLKTLEEPPPHVIFMLATTEVEKLPETIVSRCEVHTFKQPTRTILKEHIVEVAKKEGFTLAPTAAELIALLADGSFRDANGILQKIIASSANKKIELDEVTLVTSAPRGELVNEVLSAIHENDPSRGLAAYRDASDANVDMRVFGKLLLEKLRAVLMLRYDARAGERLQDEFSDEDITLLDTFAKAETPRITSATLVRFLDAYAAIARAYIPQLPLELALLDVVAPK